jgi:hypothetical protein
MVFDTDVQAVGIEAHLEAVPESDEGIAGEALTALDALEQETWIERTQLGKSRDGRVQIPCDVEWRLQKMSLGKRKNPSRCVPEMGSGS